MASDAGVATAQTPPADTGGREADIAEANRLKERLLAAARAYYQGSFGGNELMSDEDYDNLLSYLRSLSDRYGLADRDPELRDLLDGRVAGGTRPSLPDDEKVGHAVPMLSLGKVNDRDGVEAYVRRMLTAGATGFQLQAKLDGCALSAEYVDGALRRISTRGDGAVGEDVSYLLDNPEVDIDGLPDRLGGGCAGLTLEVRGELFIRLSDYEAADASRIGAGLAPFKNYRNANAGIIKAAKRGLGYHARLTFVMYRTIADEPTEHQLAQAGLNDINTVTPAEWARAIEPATGLRGDDGVAALRRRFGVPEGADGLVVPADGDADRVVARVMAIVDAFGPVRDDGLDIPTDGIVVKPANEHEMDHELGSNAHHPLSQIAFKYPGAKGVTVVRGVRWTIGKTGQLTPTFDLDAVDIGGTTVRHASAHNVRYLAEHRVSIGSRIFVERRHDVIPQLSSVISTPDDAEPIEPPAACPFCGGALRDSGRKTYCDNQSCPSRRMYALRYAVGKGGLDIDGMGPSIVEALQSDGRLDDIADLYKLDEATLAATDTGEDGSTHRVGTSNARHMLTYIEASKGLPLRRILTALAIRGLGPQTAKAITARYLDMDSLLAATPDELAKLENIGDVTARDIADGLAANRDLIGRLRAAGVAMTEPDAGTTEDQSTGFVRGRRFSISGEVPSSPGNWSNRTGWREWIEAHGGEAQTSPNRDTDYMIGDPASTSGKMTKAKRLGVTIITPDEFLRMAGLS